ncbi:MAG TPA: hypothetical protein DEO32_00475 [Ruminococcaceae bacterium]|nr:hypothetical protein [Oscillospiraceae bacterium]
MLKLLLLTAAAGFAAAKVTSELKKDSTKRGPEMIDTTAAVVQESEADVYNDPTAKQYGMDYMYV